jgi:hypothetical protein
MSNATPPNDALTVRRARNGEASPPQTVQVWLIIGANGKFTLFLLNLTDTQTVVTVMHILRKKYKACKPKFLWYHTRVQIEEAELSPVSLPLCFSGEGG